MDDFVRIPKISSSVVISRSTLDNLVIARPLSEGQTVHLPNINHIMSLINLFIYPL